MEANEYRQYLYHAGKLLWRSIENEWNLWLEGEDVSINEHSILLQLYEHGEMTITDLSKLGTMHVSTALNFSKKLDSKGFLEMRKDETDRRTTRAHLTEAGRKKVERIEAGWKQSDSLLVEKAISIENFIGEKPIFADIIMLLKVANDESTVDRIFLKETVE